MNLIIPSFCALFLVKTMPISDTNNILLVLLHKTPKAASESVSQCLLFTHTLLSVFCRILTFDLRDTNLELGASKKRASAKGEKEKKMTNEPSDRNDCRQE